MKKIDKKNALIFDSDGPIFMGASREIENSKICIFGVPYDGTTSYKPGSRFGPNAIREVSKSLETYCPQLKIDLESIKFSDLGNIEISHGAPEPVIKLVKEATSKIEGFGCKPLLLGGEHSVSSGAVDAISKKFNDLVIIHIDAHADLRDEWMGSKHNHACAMRRCLDVLPSKKIIHFGIRSGTKKEFDELELSNNFVSYQTDIAIEKIYEALNPLRKKPIYISFDLDWFDPSILSATGTPEPGGYQWNDFAVLIDIFKEFYIVGADIVELSPQNDNTGVSNILAAKVTRSILMLLSLSN